MIIGMVLFAFMRALGELLLSNTQYNSFVDIANDFLGPFGGFVIGWTYWISWIISSMSDLTAMGQYFSFWFPNFPHWITVLSIVFMLTLFNLLGRNYLGKSSFGSRLLKL